MKNILSYGGGLNSTALLVLLIEKQTPPDLVLFADTGEEQPWTYDTVEFYSRYCAKKGIQFVTVQSKLGSMMEDMMKHRVIPAVHLRYCTSKWKKEPMRSYLNHNLGKEKRTQLIGIDAGEFHRMTTSDVSYEEWRYPLVDERIDREGCKRFLIERKLPVPRKSGCWFCPYQRKTQWVEMFRERPEQFAKAETFEKNNRHYPKKTLFPKMPLERLRGRIDDSTQMSLIEEPEEPSCSVAAGCFL